MATRFLGWLKNRPRFALAILFVGAYSYAIDRWFLSGVVDSKWIGLPQYEQAMKELQEQSRNWGIVALALGIVALPSGLAVNVSCVASILDRAGQCGLD